MKYLLTVILGVMFSFSVFASPNVDEPTEKDVQPFDKVVPQDDERLQYLPIMIQCGNAEKMIGVLEDHDEQPFITGQFSVILPSGQVITQPGAVYMNPQTGTVSVVIAFAESKKVCHILNGSEFGPAVSQGSFLKS